VHHRRLATDLTITWHHLYQRWHGRTGLHSAPIPMGSPRPRPKRAALAASLPTSGARRRHPVPFQASR